MPPMNEALNGARSSKTPFLAHPRPRPGQSEMIADATLALSERGFHVAAAPTGIGKTAAALAAAVEVARQRSVRTHVLFLTGRQSQHKIVVDTVRKINANLPNEDYPLRVVDVIGRESMCEVLDPFTGRCMCETGSEEATKFERKESLKSFILHQPRHVEETLVRAKSVGVCAWQTCRSTVKEADILVCDYNHVFAEQVRESSLPAMGITLQNSLIIIDEAHNLPDRIRMTMERVITPTIVRNAAMELEEHMGNLENAVKRDPSPSTTQLLEAVRWSFEVIKAYRSKLTERFSSYHETTPEEEELRVEIDDFTGLLHTACDEVEGLTGQMRISTTGETTQHPAKEDRLAQLASALFTVQVEAESDEETSEPDAHRVGHILQSVHRFGQTTALCIVFSPKGREGKLTMHLLDPGLVSKPVFEQSGGSLLMSGTLYPPEMYAHLLALPANNTTTKAYPSPFAAKRRPVVVGSNVTTKYTERGASNTQRIRNHIQGLLDASPGNVAIFAPSYAMLNEIVLDANFKGVRQVVKEDRDWTKNDLDKIVDRLLKQKAAGGKVLLAGVFGARLSEGVDYHSGALDAVVCIGIPNSPPSVLSKALKAYAEERFGRNLAWRYTVSQPAINSILQAMGRPIRSVADRALVLLLDRRVTDRTYTKCFPADLRMYEAEDSEATHRFARRFFAKVERDETLEHE